MKGLRLLFLASVLLLVSACGVTMITPEPTRALVAPAGLGAPSSAGNGQNPAAAAGGAAAQGAATRARASIEPAATATPAVTPSPSPTRVLYAPLSSILPTPKTTPTTARVQASTSVSLPAPSASGRIVMQLATGGDIITVNADGSGKASLAAGIDPSWSPDGKQIAYTSWNEPQGIYVMNADGSNKRLVYKINGAKSPIWSPDGGTVGFVWKYRVEQRTNRQGDPVGLATDYWRVSFINLATGNKTDMPMDPDLHAFVPAWSSTNQIAYKGMRGLFVSDLTNTPAQITGYPLDDNPVWSPDGTRLALATHRQDHWDIAVANPNGSGYTIITSSPTTLNVKPIQNVAPRWSPDGKSIAFLSDRDGDWHVYVMNPDGSNQRKLLDIAVKYDFAGERVFDWTK